MKCNLVKLEKLYYGDLDLCEITKEERERGIDINDLIRE